MATDSGQHIFGLQIVIAVDRQWTCGDGHASLPYLSVDPRKPVIGISKFGFPFVESENQNRKYTNH